MSNETLFTSESVSEGHPDKMADQISDAILDALLKEDIHSRVACETMVKTGMVVLAGEITTNAWVDTEQLVRDVVCEIGYDSAEVGFDGRTCAVLSAIGKQSSDIAMGVNESDDHEQGAGDQGMMFGYASNETDVLMPAPITYSHRLVERQAELRKNGTLTWLRPDAKSQVTFRYSDGKPVGIDAVVLAVRARTQYESGPYEVRLRLDGGGSAATVFNGTSQTWHEVVLTDDRDWTWAALAEVVGSVTLHDHPEGNRDSDAWVDTFRLSVRYTSIEGPGGPDDEDTGTGVHTDSGDWDHPPRGDSVAEVDDSSAPDPGGCATAPGGLLAVLAGIFATGRRRQR